MPCQADKNLFTAIPNSQLKLLVQGKGDSLLISVLKQTFGIAPIALLHGVELSCMSQLTMMVCKECLSLQALT